MTPRPKLTGVMTTADGRTAGYCWSAKPRCVHPHTLRVKSFVTDTITTCQSRPRRGATPCCALVYVRKLRIDSATVWFVCEITDAHVERLRGEHMTFLEIMTVLGCVLPGVEMDLPEPEAC